MRCCTIFVSFENVRLYAENKNQNNFNRSIIDAFVAQILLQRFGMKTLNTFFALAAFVILISPLAIHADENHGDPDISDVHKVALDYARIRPEDISNLQKRTRRAAYLPLFQVGTKQTFQNNVNIGINDNVSVTSTGTSIGPQTTDAKQYVDNNTDFEVKAVWRLNEIIYNSDMLNVAEEARVQIRERRDLLSNVNRLYFERQRLLDEGEGSPKNASLNRHIAEVTAELDAFTGGWYSEQLKNRRVL